MARGTPDRCRVARKAVDRACIAPIAQFGFAASFSTATGGGVCHRAQHPQARPGLGDLVVAAAGLDGHPLAAELERLRRAAAEIVARHPDASPDDVLLRAEARAVSAA
jgi:hypothetical protein